jgi:hypothetical protein
MLLMSYVELFQENLHASRAACLAAQQPNQIKSKTNHSSMVGGQRTMDIES